jgi:DHA1 family inner membrane transport protein
VPEGFVLTTEVTALRRQQWRVLLPVGLAMVLSLSGDLTLYTVLPAYASALGLGLSAVGVLLSANRLIRLAGNPAVGLLLDRWGRRRLFVLGMALGTLSTAGYVVSQQFWFFLASRLLWGISWSLINVGAYAMLVDTTQETNRGWGFGVLQAFFFAGMAVNPLLGGLLTDWLSFQAALAVCTVLTGLGFIIALLALPETMPGHRRSRAPVRRRWRPIDAIRWLSKQRRLLAVDYLALLTDFAGDGIVLSTLSLYLEQQYGDTIAIGGPGLRVASIGGALLALRAIVSAGVSPIAGRLSDRVSNRWVTTGWGLVIGVLGMVGLVWISDLWGLLLSVTLISLSGGVLRTVLPALVGDLAEEAHRGAATGGLATAADIGSAAGPLMAYTLLALISLQSVYLLSAIGMTSGLIVVWLASRPHARAPLNRPQTE